MLNKRGGGVKYGILFICSLFYEYSNLECVHIHVRYRANQAEYVIRTLVAASQEYVNAYSTRKVHYEQALVCLSNREIVDASRGCTVHCKMANNRLITFLSVLVLA